MSATTSPLGPDFTKQVVDLLMKGVADATVHGYEMFWQILISFLIQNWGMVLLVLAVILLLAFLEFLMTRRWKTLGSVLYTYFYYGIMFLIGLAFGPAVYANDYFPIVGVIVYAISFTLVRISLNRSGIRRSYR